MATENNIIELRHVKKCYEKDTPVIKDFSLTIKKGEFVTFLGPSGCGKSTFFHLISGLTHADSGEILFEGKDLCKLSAKEWTHLRATQISYVLQGDSLLGFDDFVKTYRENDPGAFAADTKPARIVASATGTPAAATGREEANAAIRAAFGK